MKKCFMMHHNITKLKVYIFSCNYNGIKGNPKTVFTGVSGLK